MTITKTQIDMAKNEMGMLEKVNYAIKYLWYSSFIYGLFGDYEIYQQYKTAYEVAKANAEENDIPS